MANYAEKIGLLDAMTDGVDKVLWMGAIEYKPWAIYTPFHNDNAMDSGKMNYILQYGPFFKLT